MSSSGRLRIFLDCGGHDGCSVRKWMNDPEHSDFICYSFEPQPEMFPYYEDLPTTLIPKAVWTEFGELPLYRAGKRWESSSLLSGKITAPVRRVDTVECIDFSHWLRENCTLRDRIVLKMDIEGAEYAVLEKMMDDGTIKMIDRLLIEWHGERCGIPKEEHDRVVRRLKHFRLRGKHWDAMKFSTFPRSKQT